MLRDEGEPVNFPERSKYTLWILHNDATHLDAVSSHEVQRRLAMELMLKPEVGG